MKEDLNPYRISQLQFDQAAHYLKLDPGLAQVLRTPKRQMVVSVPTKMDDGSVKVFEGYRVQTATDGDLTTLHELVELLRHPFDESPGRDRYALPAPREALPYVTYCGT